MMMDFSYTIELSHTFFLTWLNLEVYPYEGRSASLLSVGLFIDKIRFPSRRCFVVIKSTVQCFQLGHCVRSQYILQNIDCLRWKLFSRLQLDESSINIIHVDEGNISKLTFCRFLFPDASFFLSVVHFWPDLLISPSLDGRVVPDVTTSQQSVDVAFVLYAPVWYWALDFSGLTNTSAGNIPGFLEQGGVLPIAKINLDGGNGTTKFDTLSKVTTLIINLKYLKRPVLTNSFEYSYVTI